VAGLKDAKPCRLLRGELSLVKVVALPRSVSCQNFRWDFRSFSGLMAVWLWFASWDSLYMRERQDVPSGKLGYSLCLAWIAAQVLSVLAVLRTLIAFYRFYFGKGFGHPPNPLVALPAIFDRAQQVLEIP